MDRKAQVNFHMSQEAKDLVQLICRTQALTQKVAVISAVRVYAAIASARARGAQILILEPGETEPVPLDISHEELLALKDGRT